MIEREVVRSSNRWHLGASNSDKTAGL